MPLIIPDETLRALGLSEEEARVEIACRLFDAGVLQINPAAKLAGLSRSELEDALIERNLPIIHYTEAMLEQDMRTLDRLAETMEAADGTGRR